MHLYTVEILALKARTLVKVDKNRGLRNLRIRHFLLPEGRSLKQISSLFSPGNEEKRTLFHARMHIF
jgi:hypothetical protein